MNGSYTLLFSLTVEHTYFDGNICSCLEITPKGRTQKIFSRYGFKWIKDQNVYQVYIKSNGSIEGSLTHIQNVFDQGAFTFEMNPIISNFNVITDFPLDWRGSITYESQGQQNTSDTDGMELIANFDNDEPKSAMAILSIQFDDIIKQQQANNEPKFVIQFEARSTRWNYYLINRSSMTLDNPKISGKEDIAFDGPTNTTLDNGENALKFTSGNQLLRLREIPVYKFKLINENANQAKTMKRSSGKVIMDGLPNPNPKRITIEKSVSGSTAISEMYVYV